MDGHIDVSLKTCKFFIAFLEVKLRRSISDNYYVGFSYKSNPISLLASNLPQRLHFHAINKKRRNVYSIYFSFSPFAAMNFPSRQENTLHERNQHTLNIIFLPAVSLHYKHLLEPAVSLLLSAGFIIITALP